MTKIRPPSTPTLLVWLLVLPSALCLIVLATPVGTRAQSPRGRALLSGTLYDVKRSVITRGSVRLLNLRTGEELTAASSDEGTFAFEGLAAGRYNLKIEAEGFEKYVRKSIRLGAGDNQNFCVTLEVRSVADVVPLKSRAGAGRPRRGKFINSFVREREPALRK